MIETIKQVFAPREKDLSAKCCATRHATLDDCVKHYGVELDERTRELRNQLADSEAKHAKRVADAQRVERETHDRLRAALVSDFYEQARAPVLAFIEEPSRKVATQLVALLKTFVEREEFELGFRHNRGPLAIDLLCYAFVDEALRAVPSAALVFGSDEPGLRFGEARSMVGKSAGSAAELQPALETLERVIGALASSCATRPADSVMTDRYALVRLCAPETVKAFDDEREQKRREALPAEPVVISRIERRDGSKALRYSDGSIAEQESAVVGPYGA